MILRFDLHRLCGEEIREMKMLILKLLVIAAFVAAVSVGALGSNWNPAPRQAPAGFFHPTGWTWE